MSMTDQATDERFMRLALDLGRRGLGATWPNPAVGAVVVKDGIIIGRGWTAPGGRPHAEPQALKRAGKAAEGATLYVTLEPCSHEGKSPPCVNSITRAGIARVVSAMEDPNPEVAGQGHQRLKDKKVVVEVGLLAQEARRAHAGHILKMTKGRPHVLLKLAVSADGKAGLAGRRPAQISSEAARKRVFQLRAQSDAILVGIGTVLADNPALSCRLPGMEGRSPVRVILDGQLKAPIASHVIATVRETPTWVFGAHSASQIAGEILEERGAKVFRVGTTKGRLNLDEVLQILASEGITRLLVEGGPTIAASFVEAGSVDEVALIRSQKALGNEAIDALEGQPLEALTQGFTLTGSEQVESDRIERYERA
ncbi:MAG: bifunctional diaminohydroxyphosphoribosylaminopyrimidine deaminase/5-amino-6-(5-phosphoribosylamino)uracil reductase RibD [Pseudolabrys sp.]|nr:bifunctional diaminohydroxyphosphoribosylaminopyrimidine deaminase/5-amino-6-(5-phosphoribosylamino)uracil reductase RibD [Pseudolabrys sp.]